MHGVFVFYIMICYFRFIILKTLRRDLIDCLPLPRRLKDYLNTPHYYSEELATQSLLTKKCSENNNNRPLSTSSSRSSQSGTPPRAENISSNPQSNCGWCLPLLGNDHCLTYILLNVSLIPKCLDQKNIRNYKPSFEKSLIYYSTYSD